MTDSLADHMCPITWPTSFRKSVGGDGLATRDYYGSAPDLCCKSNRQSHAKYIFSLTGGKIESLT